MQNNHFKFWLSYILASSCKQEEISISDSDKLSKLSNGQKNKLPISESSNDQINKLPVVDESPNSQKMNLHQHQILK